MTTAADSWVSHTIRAAIVTSRNAKAIKAYGVSKRFEGMLPTNNFHVVVTLHARAKSPHPSQQGGLVPHYVQRARPNFSSNGKRLKKLSFLLTTQFAPPAELEDGCARMISTVLSCPLRQGNILPTPPFRHPTKDTQTPKNFHGQRLPRTSSKIRNRFIPLCCQRYKIRWTGREVGPRH